MKSCMKKLVCVALLIWYLPGVNRAAAATDVECRDFTTAMQQAGQGKVDDALARLKLLIETDFDRGYVHYNLSRLYALKKQSGQALAHALIAQRMLPRFAPAKEWARHLTSQIVPTALFDDERILKGLYPFAIFLDLAEWSLLVGIVSLSLIAMGLLRFWRPSFRLVNLGLSLMVPLYLYLATGLYLQHAVDQSRAVVVSKQALVRDVFIDTESVKFEIQEGMLLKILDTHQPEGRGYWYRVQLPSGESGWVMSSDVMMLFSKFIPMES